METYIGEAAACDFTHKPGAAITPDDFRDAGVRRGDIVLAWGSPDEWSLMPSETIDWLIETRIKALGMENISGHPPGDPDDVTTNYDAKILLAGIGLIDGPRGLDQIKKPRVFFIGLPVRMHRITASWTRAIALEEL